MAQAVRIVGISVRNQTCCTALLLAVIGRNLLTESSEAASGTSYYCCRPAVQTLGPITTSTAVEDTMFRADNIVMKHSRKGSCVVSYSFLGI